MKPPIFIVGANRSGTTLLRLILNAHSNIAIPEELEYLESRPSGIPIERWRNPGIDSKWYERFVTRTLNTRASILEGLDMEKIKAQILTSGANDFRAPYQMMLESWMRLQGKVRFGEKTPGNLFYVDILIDMFPEAKFIYVVRDPRAGVSSMLEASFFPEDLVFNALSRHKYATEGRSLLENSVPASQRMTVRFEDLVQSPHQTVKAICDFIEEEFEPEMLQFHKNASNYMGASAAKDFNAAATKPIAPQIAEKWRQKLSRAEVAIIEYICADEMQAFGYAREGYAPRWRDYLMIAVKKAYWNLQCRRNRNVRHYIVRHKMFAFQRSRINNRIKSLSSIVPGSGSRSY